MSTSVNSQPPRRIHSVRQRQSKGLDDPEGEYRRITEDPERLMSSDDVWKQVQNAFDGSEDDDLLQTSLNVSLICPLSKRRIETPARGRSCPIRHCFDLMIYLLDKKTRAIKNDPVKFECPYQGCNAKLPLEDLRIDGLLREALESYDADVMTVEIRPDGLFPVASQQDVAHETIDNDAVLGDVEEKPDPRLSIPRSALDKVLAAIDDCVASLRDSEGDLVAKLQHVRGSVAHENGVARARAKSNGELEFVRAKTKEIAERFGELKMKVDAFMLDVSRDDDQHSSMSRSELCSFRDAYLEITNVLSTVALPSSGPIRDGFACLDECMKDLIEAAQHTAVSFVRDASLVGEPDVDELEDEPPAKRTRVEVKVENELNEGTSDAEDPFQGLAALDEAALIASADGGSAIGKEEDIAAASDAQIAQAVTREGAKHRGSLTSALKRMRDRKELAQTALNSVGYSRGRRTLQNCIKELRRIIVEDRRGANQADADNGRNHPCPLCHAMPTALLTPP